MRINIIHIQSKGSNYILQRQQLILQLMQFCDVCESVHSRIIDLYCSHRVCLICAARNFVNQSKAPYVLSNINQGKYICSICYQPTQLTQKTMENITHYNCKHHIKNKPKKTFHDIDEYININTQHKKKEGRVSRQKHIQMDYFPGLIVDSPKFLKNKLKSNKKSGKHIKSAKDIRIKQSYHQFASKQSLRDSLRYQQFNRNKANSSNSIHTNRQKGSSSMQRLLFSNATSIQNSSILRKSQQNTGRNCSQHQHNQCSYFCFDCQKGICSQCTENSNSILIQERHKDHIKVSYAQATHNLEEQISKLLTMLTKKRKQNQQVRKQIDTFFGQIRKIQLIEIQKLQAQFQDLYNVLKCKQKQLFWQIKVREEKLVMLYEAQSLKVQHQFMEIQSSIKALQNIQMELSQIPINILSKKTELQSINNKIEGRKQCLDKIIFNPFQQKWYKELDIVYAYPSKKDIENIKKSINTLTLHFQNIANNQSPQQPIKNKQTTSIEEMLKKENNQQNGSGSKQQSKQLDIQNFPDIISYSLSKTSSFNQSANDYLFENQNISSIFKNTSKI